MAVRKILLADNPVLRRKATRVRRIDNTLQALVGDMIDTMRAAPGLGLAAPQIGVPLRVVVLELDGQVHVLLNPEIVKAGGEWEPVEGCLSLPGYMARVKRAYEVTAKAKNHYGKEIRLRGEGLLAQAVQHEIDHLDGILFVDRLDSPDQLRPASEFARELEMERGGEPGAVERKSMPL